MSVEGCRAAVPLAARATWRGHQTLAWAPHALEAKLLVVNGRELQREEEEGKRDKDQVGQAGSEGTKRRCATVRSNCQSLLSRHTVAFSHPPTWKSAAIWRAANQRPCSAFCAAAADCTALNFCGKHKWGDGQAEQG